MMYKTNKYNAEINIGEYGGIVYLFAPVHYTLYEL